MNINSIGEHKKLGEEGFINNIEQDLFVLENYINDVWQFLPIPVAYLSPLGLILDISHSLEEFLHYTKEEIVGDTLDEFFVQKGKLTQIQKLTFERGRVNNEECVIKDKEGKEIPVSISTLVRKDDTGETIGYFVALVDVSKCKVAEQTLTESESQYRATLNSLADSIHVVDKQLKLVIVNQSLRKRIKELGIDIEPIGKSIYEVFGFLPAEVKEEYNRVFETGQMLVTEEQVKVGNREYFSEVRKIPIFEGALVKQVLTIIHDITERRHAEQIKLLLYKISNEASTTQDLDELFRAIQHHLGTFVDTTNFFIALRNKEEDAISLAYCAGEKKSVFSSSAEVLTSYVVKKNRPLLVTDEDVRRMAETGEIEIIGTPSKVWLGIPLRIKNDVIGAMVVQNYTNTRVYTRKELEIMEFVSDQIALAIERKRTEENLKQSVERLKKTTTSVIFTMAKILELRDPYTAGHQQRVARLACAIARELGLSEEKVDGIFMAALIHDIGKIYVPAEILNRPARLNETEMNLIRTHPKVGYDIIKTIDFSQPVDQIVIQHHERINGSGYPDGISGDRMLLEAKILAVADVVEAMASHRPYRPALNLDETLQEIRDNRSTLYDTQVVNACVRLFNEKGFKLD